MEDPDEEEEEDWMVRLDAISFRRRVMRSDGVSESGMEGRDDDDEDSGG